ncbi:hypothetical protein Tco_0369513 [Tanacetum coccineum]
MPPKRTTTPMSDVAIKALELAAEGQSALLTILLGLLEDIYVVVDSCETAQEIWLRVQQMMKGSNIGIQEKKAKLFNEWERFTSTDGQSIEYGVTTAVVGHLARKWLSSDQGERMLLIFRLCCDCHIGSKAGIQLQAKEVEFDGCCIGILMEIEESLNAKLHLMANLQQASTSGTQTDKATIYDSDESAEVHH